MGFKRAAEWVLIALLAVGLGWMSAHIASRYYSEKLTQQAKELSEAVRLYDHAKHE